MYAICRRALTLSIAAAIFAPLPACYSQDAASAPADADAREGGHSSTDLEAIRSQSTEFVEAFNRGDAKAIATMWTPDGEYVDDRGNEYVGRDAIERGYANLFTENPNAKLQLTIDALRMVSSNVAIEDGSASLESASREPSLGSHYTAVHVKADGRWLLASVRDRHAEATAANDVSDLDWLIGTWLAEEHGVKTENVCRWICDRRFVERRYHTVGKDGAETAGLQIVGFNAQEGHVQSWSFSPDGGFAVGIWTPLEGGWQATVHGVTGDGESSIAINRLELLDDNAYVWQSTGRALGDTPLPDSDEVIFRRKPTSGESQTDKPSSKEAVR